MKWVEGTVDNEGMGRKSSKSQFSPFGRCELTTTSVPLAASPCPDTDLSSPPLLHGPPLGPLQSAASTISPALSTNPRRTSRALTRRTTGLDRRARVGEGPYRVGREGRRGSMKVIGISMGMIVVGSRMRWMGVGSRSGSRPGRRERGLRGRVGGAGRREEGVWGLDCTTTDADTTLSRYVTIFRYQCD